MKENTKVIALINKTLYLLYPIVEGIYVPGVLAACKL